jgi:hypothetical protein
MLDPNHMHQSGHGPEAYSMIQYLGVLLLAVWGGVVNFLQGIRWGKAFSVMELIGELATSGFAGILSFYLCEAADFDPLLTAVTVGIAGHMGGRTIALIERIFSSRLEGAVRKMVPGLPESRENDENPN